MATTNKVPRSKSQGKASADASAPQASPFQYTGAAFDGGEGVREDCTAADLFRLVFEAPDQGQARSFLTNVVSCAADDWALLQSAATGDMPSDEVLARVALRNEWRLRVAVEVADRMAAAAKAEVQP